ncbi:5-formyltetrahydrofolate cyclo-ligase [Shewanella sp. 10N.7]|uniref:5-formyltetrahydrofolate cyclo-ligase n=1 Tax=Shewanella sp. 10N.7 TaxID=2885093 RepID=UPI001E44897A|nr:5-formyltetrahydrofolate cyclo-ligase [Shewanella sp. 10N.7]MCC4832540.1 5-formyltetrahydrofolate cyclo-ligase [Shewanella sp. 10N.7]
MSMTRFMTNSDEQPLTQAAIQTSITYFSSSSTATDPAVSHQIMLETDSFTDPSLSEPIFDSNDMSRDNIRRHIRQQRNGISAADQNQLALIASRHLLAEIQRISAKRVALYLGFDGELATGKLIEALWKHDVEVYLPRLHPFAKGHLLFMRYTPDTQMINNRYDIAEPKLDIRHMVTVNQLDMIVTPLVAFDDQGNRMGMGGGFYDRTLAQVTDNKPLAVGYAHDCQQVSFLPIEYWDVPLPVIITPTRRIFSAHLG